jgi:uncharacterized membrane protein
VGNSDPGRDLDDRTLPRRLLADGGVIMDYVPAISRWIHLLAGMMWLGLLYYFNFVQVSALKAAQADGSAAAIMKHIAPRALFFFRWSAVLTWLAGASLLGANFGNAFMLRPSHAAIGIGAWLSDDEKNKARRVAYLTSRINTVLSIPMLFFMAAGAHGAIFFS